MSSGCRRIHSHEVGTTISQGSTPMTTQAPRHPMVAISASTSGAMTTSPTLMPAADMPVALPRRLTNHFASVLFVTTWLNPAWPIAPITPKKRKNCQNEFTCDISIVARPITIAPAAIR